MNPLWIEEIVRRALTEDVGPADISTRAAVAADATAEAVILAKAEGCLAGTHVAAGVFRTLDPAIRFASLPDGSSIEPGTEVATIAGPARAILTGERVALNFLQHLSGVATATRQAAVAAEPYGVKVVDTRKTTPGLRALEKEAVRVGGGANHRMGLYDAVMLKENHIALAGGITEGVRRARAYVGHTVKIEVEVERLDQIDEAIAAGADIILLDNMSLTDMRSAVERIGGKAIVEASGGITPERVAQVAACGVDVISLGWITHSVPALDLSLRIQ